MLNRIQKKKSYPSCPISMNLYPNAFTCHENERTGKIRKKLDFMFSCFFQRANRYNHFLNQTKQALNDVLRDPSKTVTLIDKLDRLLQDLINHLQPIERLMPYYESCVSKLQDENYRNMQRSRYNKCIWAYNNINEKISYVKQIACGYSWSNTMTSCRTTIPERLETSEVYRDIPETETLNVFQLLHNPIENEIEIETENESKTEESPQPKNKSQNKKKSKQKNQSKEEVVDNIDQLIEEAKQMDTKVSKVREQTEVPSILYLTEESTEERYIERNYENNAVHYTALFKFAADVFFLMYHQIAQDETKLVHLSRNPDVKSALQDFLLNLLESVFLENSDILFNGERLLFKHVVQSQNNSSEFACYIQTFNTMMIEFTTTNKNLSFLNIKYEYRLDDAKYIFIINSNTVFQNDLTDVNYYSEDTLIDFMKHVLTIKSLVCFIFTCFKLINKLNRERKTDRNIISTDMVRIFDEIISACGNIFKKSLNVIQTFPVSMYENPFEVLCQRFLDITNATYNIQLHLSINVQSHMSDFKRLIMKQCVKHNQPELKSLKESLVPTLERYIFQLKQCETLI